MPGKPLDSVANAGGMGAMGALLTPPDGMPFQLNVWIPDPPARRDPDAEDASGRFSRGGGRRCLRTRAT